MTYILIFSVFAAVSFLPSLIAVSISLVAVYALEILSSFPFGVESLGLFSAVACIAASRRYIEHRTFLACALIFSAGILLYSAIRLAGAFVFTPDSVEIAREIIKLG